MIPFLSFDLTNNKDNGQPNGDAFLIQTPSPALAAALEKSSEKAEKTEERAKLPLPLRIAQYVFGCTALLFGGSVLKSDISFAEGYQNAPWVYWTAAISAAIWLMLWVWSKIKSKTVLETEESAQTLSHLESTADAIYKELSVPSDAKDIDILSFFYKIKDGQIKLVDKLGIAQYINPEFKIFADEENLYLANLDGKYAFPLSSIVKVHTVKKHIRILGWNKEEKFNKGIYKPYKLTTDNYGCIHCKEYHIVEVVRDGESFGIYIPSYELPVLEECTK